MATAPVYRLTIIKTVYSQLKLKRIQGGWYKLCEASGVRSTQQASKQASKQARKQGSKEARKQGSKEKLSQQNAILNDPFSIKLTIYQSF